MQETIPIVACALRCICSFTRLKTLRIRHVIHVTTLTQWCRVTHICISKLTLIGSDNGFSPARRQAIIWYSAGILLNQNLWTNLSETLRDVTHFHSRNASENVVYEIATILSRPQCVNCRFTVSIMARSWALRPAERFRRKWYLYTVKPVYNTHHMGYFSAFWSSSRWPDGRNC